MGVKHDNAEEIRNKDGVYMYRVFSGDNSYILKYFENQSFKREIENYRILNSLAIPTIMDMDFIVSFNFKHIVKRKTMLMTEVINVREGYKKIGIFAPAEVIENDE